MSRQQCSQMDWAINAAKKKTKAIPGGSRSIIESLNKLNNISCDGQDAINEILSDIDFSLLGISILPADKNRSLIIKTKNIEHLDTKPDSKDDNSTRNELKSIEVNPLSEDNSTVFNVKATLSSAAPKKNKDLVNTPIKRESGIPSITPKSMSIEKKDENGLTSNDVTIATSSSLKEKDSKSGSPTKSEWSPFKSNKSFSNLSSNINETLKHQNHNIIDTHNQTTTKEGEDTSILSNNDKNKAESETKISSKSFTNKERVLRKRSNMFIPLPTKETYVIKSSPDKQSNNQEVSKLGSMSKSNKLHNLKSEMPLTIKDVRLDSSKQNLNESSEKNRKLSASDNVFERLAKVPTKSFEKKITKTYKPYSDSKSMYSPTRKRNSLAGKGIIKTTSGQVDTSMNETLKGIFELNSPKTLLSNDSKAQIVSSSTSIATNKGMRKSLQPRIDVKSLSTVTSRLIPNGRSELNDGNNKVNLHSNKSSHGIYLNKMKPTERLTPIRIKSGNTITSPTESSLLKLSNRGSPKRVAKLHHKLDSKDPAKQKNDRLTNFQLLPSLESKKNELKKKLNKRLSEVMRSQQDHHRRRTELQKRKSQIYEDLKKRTKPASEIKDSNKKNVDTSLDGSNFIRYRDKTHNDTNSEMKGILDTINTVDHRIIIGESTRNQEENVGDATLPEIYSDSEADDTLVLATWAETANLKKALVDQAGLDPNDIFGPAYPLKPEELFSPTRMAKLKSKH